MLRCAKHFGNSKRRVGTTVLSITPGCHLPLTVLVYNGVSAFIKGASFHTQK